MFFLLHSASNSLGTTTAGRQHSCVTFLAYGPVSGPYIMHFWIQVCSSLNPWRAVNWFGVCYLWIGDMRGDR